MPMGITGENLAEKYNITRQDCDEFALLSQKRWAEGKGLSVQLQIMSEITTSSQFLDVQLTERKNIIQLLLVHWYIFQLIFEQERRYLGYLTFLGEACSRLCNLSNGDF